MKSKGPTTRGTAKPESRALREFAAQMVAQDELERGTPPADPKDWPNRAKTMTEAEFLKGCGPHGQR